MNKFKPTHSLTAKIIAIILLVITITATIASSVCVLIMADNDMYLKENITFFNSDFIESMTYHNAQDIFYNYTENSGEYIYYSNTSYLENEISNNIAEYSKSFTPDKTNLFFKLQNEKGETLFSNYSEQSYSFKQTYRSTQYSDHLQILTCYVKSDLTAKDEYYVAKYWFDLAYSMRYVLIVIAVIGLILSIILFIFLMCSAGHRKGKETVTLNGIDKIPFDLYLALILFIAFLSVAAVYKLYYKEWYCFFYLIPVAIVDLLCSLSLCMTFATRYKLGGWWKNTLIFRFLKLIKRIIVSVIKFIRTIFNNFSLLWKFILIFGLISLTELIFMISLFQSRDLGLLSFLWLCEKALFGIIICYAIIHLNQLKKGTEVIASGNLEYKIDTSKMRWDLKRHGENINNINKGLSKAVDERIKSERFKTELITNISHDIKTPLTSIINYVDLIKKEGIDNETVQQYISVLDRQSSRLKKMTEDLVEASKASTGNITVSPTRTDVKELLSQAVGEYDERLNNCSLEAVLNLPESITEIYADGRLLWRVFDNLLSNICKYSQPNTRVYFEITDKNDRIEICIKNISKYSLNISSSELLERFVRGDSSRSTEGSGLGLSIAKSLTKLQNGCFDLFIDGDLFKAIITFDKMK